MQRYNQDLDQFDSSSWAAVCKAALRLSSTGFVNLPQNVPTEPRIVVSPALLIELLVAVRYSMCNGQSSLALKAMEATHRRASYELYAEVLLVTNAFLNAHQRGDFHFEEQRPSKMTQALRSTITNASFKAKKLPDDIEFVEDEESRLATVEETEAEHSGVAKGIKAKLMNIGGKLGGGDRGKHREVRRDSDTSSSMKIVQDSADSVDVAVVKGGGREKVDMLEMQPVGPGFNGDMKELEEEGDTVLDMTASINSSPLIFSKKHGGNKGHLAGKKWPGASSPPSIPYSSSPSLTNNGKTEMGLTSSPRAQSEGPTSLSSLSHVSSGPASQHQVNSVELLVASPSSSSHSMPGDLKTKGHVNRNSYSTDL